MESLELTVTETQMTLQICNMEGGGRCVTRRDSTKVLSAAQIYATLITEECWRILETNRVIGFIHF